MTFDTSRNGTALETTRRLVVRSDIEALQTIVIATGIGWSALFVLIGLQYELQLYADGSIFSYAIAANDAWAFHWHNISPRFFVFLFSNLPAEAYVALTRDPHGGVVVYGLLFYSAPLLGLAATFAADRSRGRIIFSCACCSTACLCPLVFGFPTEMWVAHALFWPTLAVCYYCRRGFGGTALVFAMLLALSFTHRGALIFAVSILATLFLRGARDAAFLRATGTFCVVVAIWMAVRADLPPDPYIGAVLVRAALHVFDIGILTGDLMRLLCGMLASYAAALYLIRKIRPAKAHLYAVAIVALALIVYWLCFDHALHAENRYYLRTLLILATPVCGAAAAVLALDAEERLPARLAFVPRLMTILTEGHIIRAAAGALMLITLVHGVETVKFVTAWMDYKNAVRNLAMSAASDPALGDAHFVSAQRINPDLNRLSWFSTTHFLSVLLAPKFAPSRLVVDPAANFFWLPCRTATANLESDRAIPAESRRLVQVYSCLHR